MRVPPGRLGSVHTYPDIFSPFFKYLRVRPLTQIPLISKISTGERLQKPEILVLEETVYVWTEG